MTIIDEDRMRAAFALALTKGILKSFPGSRRHES